jgi:hypothetical protein
MSTSARNGLNFKRNCFSYFSIEIRHEGFTRSCKIVKRTFYTVEKKIISGGLWGTPPGLKIESLAGGVQQPGVVVGALEAGVQAQRLSGQLSRGQGAGVGQ